MGGVIGLHCLNDSWLWANHTDVDHRQRRMPDAGAVGHVCLGVSPRTENPRDQAFHICIILWCRRIGSGGVAPWLAF